MTPKVDWREIFAEMVRYYETKLELYLVVDEAVLHEVAFQAEKSLQQFNQNDPNIAKIAGSVSFWIRKLKPLSVHPSAGNSLTSINEHISLLVGLAMCRRYAMKEWMIHPGGRVFHDWVTSLRFHSHSPSSTVLAFELLTNPTAKRQTPAP